MHEQLARPILQPPPLERLAWLKPGDRIGHRTLEAIGPISGKRAIATTRDGQPATIELTGSHLWLRTTEGASWAEWPKHGQRSLHELASDVGNCIQCDTPDFPHHAVRLMAMQRDAGFQFYPAQAAYALNIARHDGVLLAAEVGTGKTLLAISLIHLRQPRRCLIIAPQGVIRPALNKEDDEGTYDASQWQREFAKFAPWTQPQFIDRSPTGDGVFLTYMQDALLNGGGWLKDVPPDFFDMIVVDEAHLLQARHTLMGQALYRMKPRLRYALTATPMPNNPRDCFPLLRWLRPDVPIELRPTKAVLIQDGKRTVLRDYHEPFSPVLFGAAIRHAVAPIRKRDLRPDMPALHIHKVMVEPEPELMRRYAELAKDFTLPTGDCGTIERVRLTKLRNLCAESTEKAHQIAARVTASDGASVVVSARKLQTSEISTLLAAEKRSIGRIDSTTNPKLHGPTSAAFQRGEMNVLLMGIKCAYGHSFPDCDNIHIVSLEWSNGSFDQALGRVYRINSQRPVHAYVYLLRGTIEERMFDDVCAKQSTANTIIFGPDSVVIVPQRADTLAPLR